MASRVPTRRRAAHHGSSSPPCLYGRAHNEVLPFRDTSKARKTELSNRNSPLCINIKGLVYRGMASAVKTYIHLEFRGESFVGGFKKPLARCAAAGGGATLDSAAGIRRFAPGQSAVRGGRHVEPRLFSNHGHHFAALCHGE